MALPLNGSIVYDRHLGDSVEAIIEDIVTVNWGLFYRGSYVLHASYTDKGGELASALQGLDTLVLRHHKVSPKSFDEQEGLVSFPLGDAVSLGVYTYPGDETESVYGMLRKIDLIGLNEIHITAIGL